MRLYPLIPNTLTCADSLWKAACRVLALTVPLQWWKAIVCGCFPTTLSSVSSVSVYCFHRVIFLPIKCMCVYVYKESWTRSQFFCICMSRSSTLLKCYMLYQNRNLSTWGASTNHFIPKWQSCMQWQCEEWGWPCSYLILRLPFGHIGLHLHRLAEHTSVNSE